MLKVGGVKIPACRVDGVTAPVGVVILRVGRVNIPGSRVGGVRVPVGGVIDSNSNKMIWYGLI